MNRRIAFTLVEVVVATVIFALVIVGLTSVFVSGNKIILHNRERATSAQLGKFFLDPLQVHVRWDKWLDSDPSNKLAIGSWPGAVQNINNKDFTEIQHNVAYVKSGWDLRRVITKISWNEAS
jgi:Tfp pilus assembly protein PilW